ncbi:hypothetical protein [Xanthobacter agilis]|uniref:Uncharacterized protein n=1 Tax=Xanthobacter agilis TaxID=47492 RepID=A0ABU0LEQ5_XANAG|nr:hypothetical protein [Xanthobacter agilis]MDQ0505630.1 hypothetical protein [Xanthobacter agilis]
MKTASPRPNPFRRSAALAVLALVMAGPALAQPKSDPEWPCPQRRTPDISLAVVWTGPDLASAGVWTDDLEASTLAVKLASRRTPLDQVDGLIDAFAKEAGPDVKVRLVRVFAGVYEITSLERAKVMDGITRYARGQNRLAERLRDEGDALSKAKDSPEAADTRETQELEQKLNWDTRIFEERARSLIYVCETPVLLEQRLFEIGRRIQDRVK